MPFASPNNRHKQRLIRVEPPKMSVTAVALLIAANPAKLTEAQRVQKIVAHAREQTTWGTVYDPAYVRLKYPGGDLPKEKGVCTDVVIRAWRVVGYDLQKLIHEDKTRRPAAYPKYPGQKGADRNIDHRRVKNMVVFFRKYGRELTRDLTKKDQWRPGDLVTWKLPGGLDHIGILTDRKNAQGLPYVVHNIGGTREEDVIAAWQVLGHFRYP